MTDSDSGMLSVSSWNSTFVYVIVVTSLSSRPHQCMTPFWLPLTCTLIYNVQWRLSELSSIGNITIVNLQQIFYKTGYITFNTELYVYQRYLFIYSKYLSINWESVCLVLMFGLKQLRVVKFSILLWLFDSRMEKVDGKSFFHDLLFILIIWKRQKRLETSLNIELP